MKLITFVALCLLTSQPCCSRSVSEDDSVVSVYLKQPPMEDNSQNSLVYLITSGLAKRITSPITNLFGFGGNVTTTTRPFHQIEIFDEVEQVSKADINPVNNEISNERDVEELSKEGAVKKDTRKPEKITLFSSYLSDDEKMKLNGSVKHVDIDSELPFTLDDVDDEDYDDAVQARDGPIVFVLEVMASLIQLVWGGIAAIFTSSSPTSNSS